MLDEVELIPSIFSIFPDLAVDLIRAMRMREKPFERLDLQFIERRAREKPTGFGHFDLDRSPLLKRLANALRRGVQVGLVIGVQ